MGGQINADSQLGEGTEFTLSFRTKSCIQKVNLTGNQYIEKKTKYYKSNIFLMKREGKEKIETILANFNVHKVIKY